MRSRREQRSAAGQLGACTQSAEVLGTPSWVARVRLRGDPVRMPSKNLPATSQLDTDFCTEFLHAPYWGNWPSRRMSKKRALTVHTESSMATTIRQWKVHNRRF